MITRRIWQKRAFITGGPRLMCSYTTGTVPPSPPPAAVTAHKLPYVDSSARLTFCSGYTSASLRLTNNSIDVLKLNSCWFSSNALPDIPLGGIVNVELAQTGEGIAECELIKWFVQEGDQVEEFQPLCEVQSDKATIEITSRYKGKVAQVLFAAGDIVKVGETLLKMVVEESEIRTQTIDGSQVPTPTHVDLENTRSLGSELNKGKLGGVLSTPAVRNLAKQYGISLHDVCGTGKDGRVLKEDILNLAIQKGILRDSSGTINATSGDLFFVGKEDSPHASTEVRQHHEDTTVPLR